MSFTQTGYLTMAFVAPVGFRDANAPGGIREEDQLNLTLKALGDEKEYQCNLAIGEKTVGLQQLEAWQAEGAAVTVFCSSVRAIAFVHDTRKDAEGNPLKKYQRKGREVTVEGGLKIETDALVVFQAYDVRPAGQVDLGEEGHKAHADFLKRQAEYKKASVQARVEKARARIAEQRATLQAEQQAAQSAGAEGKARKTA